MLRVLLVLSSAALAQELLPNTMSFAAWIEHFGEHPNSVSHTKSLMQRIQDFAANIQKIEDHNAQGQSWKMGVNQFADLTKDEWSNLIGFGKCYEGMKETRERFNERQVGRLPQMRNPENAESIDWRDEGAVTPVKDQGSCGSCWAFSTTGSVEGAYYKSSGSLVSLSEEELVQCDGTDDGCGGGLMDYAFEWIMSNGGISTDDDYPYTSGGGVTGTCDYSKEANKVVKVSTYHDVSSNSESALENAVNDQPVSIAIEADQSGFQLYSSGVFTGTCGDSLDHGVLVVGYGSSDGLEYWTVKNSWAKTWGEEGYIRIEKGTGGSGKCGILAEPSYPVC